MLDQVAQQFFAALVLEVEGDCVLVRVEHGEWQVGAAHVAAAAQMFPALRLDLNDARPGQRDQQRRVRPVIDVTEIDDRDPGQRIMPLGLRCVGARLPDILQHFRSRPVYVGARIPRAAACGEFIWIPRLASLAFCIKPDPLRAPRHIGPI